METPKQKNILSKKSDAEWKETLSPELYRIARQKGTEAPFSGKYNTVFDQGIYTCGCCGAELFASDEKFNSGCGWPAFAAPKDEQALHYEQDNSYGMIRTEVQCSTCGAHLGHVFNDGPRPTGLRFCINSASLLFAPTKDNTTNTDYELGK